MDEVDRQLRAMLQAAMEQDPSIEPEAGLVILRACLAELAERPEADAAEVARHYVAQHRGVDASWVAHLACAAVGTRKQ